MGCYIFGIRVVVPLGSVRVSLLSFCCVFLVTFLAWLWYLLSNLMVPFFVWSELWHLGLLLLFQTQIILIWWE